MAFEGSKAGGLVWHSGTVMAQRRRKQDFVVLFNTDKKRLLIDPLRRHWRRVQLASAPPLVPAPTGVGAGPPRISMAMPPQPLPLRDYADHATTLRSARRTRRHA